MITDMFNLSEVLLGLFFIHELSESVNRRITDNTMAKTKRQITIYKICITH